MELLPLNGSLDVDSHSLSDVHLGFCCIVTYSEQEVKYTHVPQDPKSLKECIQCILVSPCSYVPYQIHCIVQTYHALGIRLPDSEAL